MQIGTWILLPALLIQFLLFATPVLPLAASIPCTISVLICGASTTYFAFWCCNIDPIDERLRCHLAHQHGENDGANDTENSRSNEGREENDDATKFCWICGIHVHESSMHCKFCNKCVENFDHHCSYLNTCVGETNYNYFFLAVGSTLSMVIMRGGVLAGLVISFFIQYIHEMTAGGPRGPIVERFDDWFGANAGLVVALVNAIFLSVDVVCLILLLQLFSFHVRLRHEGITVSTFGAGMQLCCLEILHNYRFITTPQTYTYIVRGGQKKREAEGKRMERERMRIAAIQKAEREGKLMKKWSLSAAGCPYVGERVCQTCDPLRWDETGEGREMQRSNSDVMDSEDRGFHIGNGNWNNSSLDIENIKSNNSLDDGVSEDEQNVIDEKKMTDPIDDRNRKIDEQDDNKVTPSALQAAMDARMKMKHQKEQHDSIESEEKKVHFLSTS